MPFKLPSLPGKSEQKSNPWTFLIILWSKKPYLVITSSLSGEELQVESCLGFLVLFSSQNQSQKKEEVRVLEPSRVS